MVKKIWGYLIILLLLLFFSNTDYTIEQLKQAIREAKEIILELQTENDKLSKENEQLIKQNKEYKQAIREAKEIIIEQNKMIRELKNIDKYSLGFGAGYYNNFTLSIDFKINYYYGVNFFTDFNSFGLIFYLYLL